MKIACQRKWQQILLKMEGFLEPKNSKDEKKMWSWDYLKKKLKYRKLFEEKDLENYFQK